MALLKARKEVSVLPAVLEADTIYAVRTGAGFDLYISDNTGAIAHKVNGGGGVAATTPNVTIQYSPDGKVSNITKSDGSTTTLTWASGLLASSNKTLAGRSTNKSFSYTAGLLSGVNVTVT